LRLQGEVAATAVEGLAGAPADARAAMQRLDKLRAEAARLGLVPVQLEARLAQGQIERKLAQPGAGERLRAVADDARAKGFARVAALAAQPPR
jgi:hypothetical protein